jgi:antitoxin HicB
VYNYSFSVAWSQEDGEYVATSSEFPGLSGLGASAEDAVRELTEAMSAAVEAFKEDGEAVPLPREVTSFSGQLRLRLPRYLHALATARADEEGVSLNALLQAYIALGVGSQLKPTNASRFERLIESLEALVARKSETVSRPYREKFEQMQMKYTTLEARTPSKRDIIPIEPFLEGAGDQRTRVQTGDALPVIPMRALQ